MAGENTTTTLSGLLKRVYGEKVTKVIPEDVLTPRLMPFQGKAVGLGEAIYEPVSLQLEHGFTYAAPGSGAFALNTPIPGATKQARVDAFQLLGQAHLDYETAARASKAKSKGAFERAMDHVMDNLTTSHRRRQETANLYGASSLGAIGSITGSEAIISEATWASGIWAGAVGAKVDIYASDGTTLHLADAVITSTDLELMTLAFSDSTDVVAGDLLYWAGSNGAEAMGIHAIITEAESLFGIDNATYDLFRGNVYAVDGALTQRHLDRAVNLALSKGYRGKMTLLLNPSIFSDLVAEQSARRRYADNPKTAKFGFESLSMYTQAGVIDVVGHTYVKMGDGFLLPDGEWKRIGAVDIKLGDPVDQDDVVKRLETAAGYQIISYSMQAPFTTRPGWNVFLSGITAAV